MRARKAMGKGLSEPCETWMSNPSLQGRIYDVFAKALPQRFNTLKMETSINFELDTLRQRQFNTPIDGIGLASHISFPRV